MRPTKRAKTDSQPAPLKRASAQDRRPREPGLRTLDPASLSAIYDQLSNSDARRFATAALGDAFLSRALLNPSSPVAQRCFGEACLGAQTAPQQLSHLLRLGEGPALVKTMPHFALNPNASRWAPSLYNKEARTRAQTQQAGQDYAALTEAAEFLLDAGEAKLFGVFELLWRPLAVVVGSPSAFPIPWPVIGRVVDRSPAIDLRRCSSFMPAVWRAQCQLDASMRDCVRSHGQDVTELRLPFGDPEHLDTLLDALPSLETLDLRDRSSDQSACEMLLPRLASLRVRELRLSVGHRDDLVGCVATFLRALPRHAPKLSRLHLEGDPFRITDTTLTPLFDALAQAQHGLDVLTLSEHFFSNLLVDIALELHMNEFHAATHKIPTLRLKDTRLCDETREAFSALRPAPLQTLWQ